MSKYQDLIDADNSEHDIEQRLVAGIDIDEQWRELQAEYEPMRHRRDPRAFGRKRQRPTRESERRLIVALLVAGFGCFVAAIGLTFTDTDPAAPFFVGLAGFVLLLTAILSLTEY